MFERNRPEVVHPLGLQPKTETLDVLGVWWVGFESSHREKERPQVVQEFGDGGWVEGTTHPPPFLGHVSPE